GTCRVQQVLSSFSDSDRLLLQFGWYSDLSDDGRHIFGASHRPANGDKRATFLIVCIDIYIQWSCWSDRKRIHYFGSNTPCCWPYSGRIYCYCFRYRSIYERSQSIDQYNRQFGSRSSHSLMGRSARHAAI